MEPKDLGLKLIDQVDLDANDLEKIISAYENLGYLVGITSEFEQGSNGVYVYHILQIWKDTND